LGKCLRRCIKNGFILKDLTASPTSYSFDVENKLSLKDIDSLLISDFTENDVKEGFDSLPNSLQNTKEFLLKFLNPKPPSLNSSSPNLRSPLSISTSLDDFNVKNNSFCTLEDLLRTHRLVKAVIMRSAVFVGIVFLLSFYFI
jgi:hypothetical protein